MAMLSTQVQLVSRPDGWPMRDDFRIVTVELPDLRPGEIRVRNEFLSVDPYMRGKMMDGPSYTPPYQLDQAMTGGAVGRVLDSATEGFTAGELVLHEQGWRDLAQGAASEFQRVPDLGLPPSTYLGILGMPGRSAYVALVRVAKIREGDVVFISGAAGAVGSAAGQIARQRGAARVIGSAGSAAKVKVLTERYGFDSAFNYQDGPVVEQLREAAPEGIDVFLDNVGGEHLEAALDVLNVGGRVAMCGAISGYNDTVKEPGPRNLVSIIAKRLTLQGFIVFDHNDVLPEFTELMSNWTRSGAVVYDETVVHGVDNAVAAFLDMMHGCNIGKMIVCV